MVPALVFVVAAPPELMPDSEIDTTTRRQEQKRVMCVARSPRKVDAANAGKELGIWFDVPEMSERKNRPGQRRILPHLRNSMRAIEVQVASFNFRPKTMNLR